MDLLTSKPALSLGFEQKMQNSNICQLPFYLLAFLFANVLGSENNCVKDI